MADVVVLGLCLDGSTSNEKIINSMGTSPDVPANYLVRYSLFKDA